MGRALAETFAAADHEVALLARDGDRVASLAADVRADGGDAVGVTADVTDPDAVAAAFDAVRDAFGSVDVLVHNATGPGSRPLDEADPETVETILRTRAFGGFLCAREVLPVDDGAVLFTGTTFALTGAPEQVGWGAGGFATRGLARSLAGAGHPATYVAVGSAITPPDGYDTDDRLAARDLAASFRDLAERDPAPVVRADPGPDGAPEVTPVE